ncbi:hypothetical protein Bhyg_07927 [Pseudolycoriella hygida]|uniref:Transposase n=1 Tax=Pseudolycoriella hygida TaxID=35572 RepID=A0A9Q0N4J5_9DIPT|nr:hypothetical protein Bhyg_07927 [Pseudolycoriella hygida]
MWLDFEVDVQNVECNAGPSFDELKKYIAELELVQEGHKKKIAEQERALRIADKKQQITNLNFQSYASMKVMASVCDQDGTNVKAINQLINLDYDKNQKNRPASGLLQYKVHDTSIIHCYDPPHLIKGIRNNLKTKTLRHHITKRWNISETGFRTGIGKQPARRASWNDLKTFYEWGNGGSTKLLPNITVEHIEPDKEKMKVINATQVFSQTYGTMMLKYCCGIKMNGIDLPKKMTDTAEILLFFNDLFDSVNGSSESGENELKAAVSENSIHFAFWEYALCMLSNMHFIETVMKEGQSGAGTKRKVSKNSRTGTTSAGTKKDETERETNRTKVIQHWQSTVYGYIEICKKCLNLGMTQISLRLLLYLLIANKNCIRRNMNQDCLENFFGCIRSLCQNQKSLITTHFRSAYTTKVVCNSINTHSAKSNCEPDCSTTLLSDVHELYLEKENIEDANTVNENTAPEEIIFDPIVFDPQFSELTTNFVANEAISNISTPICRKLIQFIKCDECRDKIETISDTQDFLYGIKYPSNLFLNNFKKLYGAVNDALPHICHEKFLRMKLIECIDEIKTDDIGCSEHIEVLHKKLKETTVVFGILTFCKRVNDLLSAKTNMLSPDCNAIEELAYSFKNKKGTIELVVGIIVLLKRCGKPIDNPKTGYRVDVAVYIAKENEKLSQDIVKGFETEIGQVREDFRSDIDSFSSKLKSSNTRLDTEQASQPFRIFKFVLFNEK